MPNIKWSEAKKHLDYLKESYENIGIFGEFGMVFINDCISRFEAGERSEELYIKILELE